jgi:hypothetical protein
MRTLSSLAIVLAIAGSMLTSCSESTSPAGTGMVTMGAKIGNGSASYIVKSDGEIKGGTTINEIRIDRVRILLSRLKFHRSSEDTGSGGRDVKVGPSVILFDSGATSTVFSEPVPVGTYNRVKLERHKFSSSEAETYAGHATFGEFVSPDRVTMIIEGTIVEGTEETPFELRDSATENLWIDLLPALTVSEGGSATIDLVFDAAPAFKDGAALLDPRTSQGIGKISKNLKHAFKLQNR